MTSAHTHKALLLQLLIFLNVVDTLLTIAVVGLKLATETNPIMDVFLQQGPIVFGLGKMVLSIGGALALWKGRDSSWSLPAISFCVIVYSFVVAYEMAMIGVIVLAGG